MSLGCHAIPPSCSFHFPQDSAWLIYGLHFTKHILLFDTESDHHRKLSIIAMGFVNIYADADMVSPAPSAAGIMADSSIHSLETRRTTPETPEGFKSQRQYHCVEQADSVVLYSRHLKVQEPAVSSDHLCHNSVEMFRHDGSTSHDARHLDIYLFSNPLPDTQDADDQLPPLQEGNEDHQRQKSSDEPRLTIPIPSGRRASIP
jgi:hypothetical protein